jgi:hypothetical protein
LVDGLKFDYSALLAAGRKSNLIKIGNKGIEILAFRPRATSSRHIKSFHDFIGQMDKTETGFPGDQKYVLPNHPIDELTNTLCFVLPIRRIDQLPIGCSPQSTT